MAKREHGQINGVVDSEGSRAKRRKESAVVAGSSSDVDVMMSDLVASGGEESVPTGPGGKEQDVKERGLQLWQAVKDAVNKE